MVQIEVTVPMEQVSLHPSTKTGSISCKTECVTSQSDQLQSIIPRPEVVPAKAIETGQTGIILLIVDIKNNFYVPVNQQCCLGGNRPETWIF